MPAAPTHGRPRHRRLRALRWLAPLVAATAVLGAVLSSPTTVVPPADPDDPVTVVLADHGRTVSLVLPRDDGSIVRYAYGEWEWYALDRTGKRDALRALLVRSQAALGRRQLEGPATAASVRRQVGSIEATHELRVPRRSVRSLLARLDALYDDNAATEVHAPAARLSFVHHPRPYTALHNSNTVTAGWLRELGCDTRGPALLSRWRIHEPRPAAAAAEVRP